MAIDERSCGHPNLSALNPHDLLRKYLCQDCAAVVTCECERDIGTFIIPRAANRAVDIDTYEEVQVTHRFVKNVCPECRGCTAKAFPWVAVFGATSSIKKYYWREIWQRSERNFLAWCRSQELPLLDDNGNPLIGKYREEYADQYKESGDEALGEIKELHASNPRYEFNLPSDAKIFNDFQVDIKEIRAKCVLRTERGPALVLPLDSTLLQDASNVEEFVARSLRAQGKQVMFCESRPFHALYAGLMWPWVQDQSDPNTRRILIPRRDQQGEGIERFVLMQVPRDFGSSAHARRRAENLSAHLTNLPDDTASLLSTFDGWLDKSWKLRHKLWAHNEVDQSRARTLIEVLGATTVKMVLTTLAEHYWSRYLGWPDLLSWKKSSDGPTEIMFTEVKSSSDSLTAEQRKWIELNSTQLKLPFQVVKVHRARKIRAEELRADGSA
jgi:hypothetical protein